MRGKHTTRSNVSRTNQVVKCSPEIDNLSPFATYLLESASYSVIEPFFPAEANRKGVGAVTTGSIFSVYLFVQVISFPLWGKYLPKIGAKTMFLVGLSTSGIGIQLFGILIALPNTNLFLVLSFITRIFESLGAAAHETALYTICAHTFPERTSFILSISEVMVGVGYAAGPAIGGILYKVGGYEFPFLILGGAVVFAVIISVFILPKQVKVHQQCGSITEILSIWFVWPILVVILIDTAGFAFFQPTLSVHLEQFYLSPIQIGLFYFATAFVYATLTPLVGYFVDKTDWSRVVILLGLCFSTVGYLLVGPSPMLHLPSELWLIICGKFILEIGWSFSLVAPFQDLLLVTERHGFPANVQRQGVIAGIFNGVFASGEFVGTSLSGVMVDNLGFPQSCTVLFAIVFFVVIIFGLFSIFELRYLKSHLVQPTKYQAKYQLLYPTKFDGLTATKKIHVQFNPLKDS
ncbi:MFS-type transporter SLC18B1-like isoform X1 [Amphiura filiformis]|uniref:MFS-type transporter SLC18B1-like isoform X1 n=1 Tax=Amphiura filiformis TaxID=82378 RepID=UPI003B220220